MFIIKSYIKHPDAIISNVQKLQQNPLAYFVDIDNDQEIIRIKKHLDLDYLEGVIYIAFNNQVIMDFAMWDLVEELWAYFLMLIAQFIRTNKAEIYFPDQPIQIIMQGHDTCINMSFIRSNGEKAEWNFPRDLLLKALLDGANHFFERLLLIFEKNQTHYLDALEEIKKLKKIIAI